MKQSAPTFLDLLPWLSSRNFFRVGKIYCYAIFFHYAKFSIVFGPNFRGGQTASGGRPSGTKPANSVITTVMWVILQNHLSTLVHIQCSLVPVFQPLSLSYFSFPKTVPSKALIFSIKGLVFLIPSNTDLSDLSKQIRQSLILRSSDALSSWG